MNTVPGLDWHWKEFHRQKLMIEQCRARSDFMDMQPDLALHSPRDKSMVAYGRIRD